MTAAEHAAAMVAFEERQKRIKRRQVTPEMWYRYGFERAQRERQLDCCTAPRRKEQGKADPNWWKGYQEGWK